MGLQKKLLLFSLLMLFFHNLSCYSNLDQEDLIIDCLDDSSSYNSSVYPTYLSMIDGESREIGYESRRFMLESFDLVGGHESSNRVVNVEDFGAKGDGTDDREAFEKAWEEACSSSSSAVFMVPENKNYFLKPVTFSGPCRSDVTIMIMGTIEASSNRSDWDGKNRRHWILFNGVENLVVGGGGTLDGNGQIWWKNSCKVNKSLPCSDAPTALTFHSCNDLIVENLSIKDSQQIHVSFQKCNNVQASNLTITAPQKSPNTDGIHVTGTKNIQIANCVIRTGDDCISIVSGSRSVEATNIVCGPGHGISIGSLGAKRSEAQVSDVMVDTASFNGTTNGVRIKTWQGGHGYARNIVFQNVTMHNVQNPIIIDQNYCDSKKPCRDEISAVEVNQVLYKNIKGTSASKVAVKFDCSKSVPCHGIVLQDINLVGEGGEPTKTICKHVRWTKKGEVIPPTCVHGT